jgi:hypothetical protein
VFGFLFASRQPVTSSVTNFFAQRHGPSQVHTSNAVVVNNAPNPGRRRAPAPRLPRPRPGRYQRCKGTGRISTALPSRPRRTWPTSTLPRSKSTKPRCIQKGHPFALPEAARLEVESLCSRQHRMVGRGPQCLARMGGPIMRNRS